MKRITNWIKDRLGICRHQYTYFFEKRDVNQYHRITKCMFCGKVKKVELIESFKDEKVKTCY